MLWKDFLMFLKFTVIIVITYIFPTICITLYNKWKSKYELKHNKIGEQIVGISPFVLS